MPAADIGDAAAPLQLDQHTFERRQPVGNEIGHITGASEPLGAAEKTQAVLVPLTSALTLRVFQANEKITVDGKSKIDLPIRL